MGKRHLPELAAPVASSVEQLLKEILVAAGLASGALSAVESDFSVLTFELGEVLLVGDSSNEGGLSPSDLYLVGEGRVRLLSFDRCKQREVGLEVVEVGGWFGAEQLLLPCQSSSYRAVGGSQGTIYRLQAETLARWLSAHPKLRPYLAAALAYYQRAAFFRSTGAAKGLTGPKIRAIAARALSHSIPAKTQVAQFTQDKMGLFWLISGEIHSDRTQPPKSEKAGWGARRLHQIGWRSRSCMSITYQPVPATTWPLTQST